METEKISTIAVIGRAVFCNPDVLLMFFDFGLI